MAAKMEIQTLSDGSIRYVWATDSLTVRQDGSGFYVNLSPGYDPHTFHRTGGHRGSEVDKIEALAILARMKDSLELRRASDLELGIE
jgi:hypothetical protein